MCFSAIGHGAGEREWRGKIYLFIFLKKLCANLPDFMQGKVNTKINKNF